MGGACAKTRKELSQPVKMEASVILVLLLLFLTFIIIICSKAMENTGRFGQAV